MCLMTTAGSPGQCRAYCDPASTDHGCAAGESCVPAAFNGNLSALVHLCIAGSVPDGGADAPSSD